MSNKIKNVLSIDMDYVMGQCIQLYNDCAGNLDFKEGDYWDKLNEIRSLDPFLKYDERKFVFLISLFSQKIVNIPAENIFFAEEHDMILEFLCGDEKKAGEIYDVYNVDHHHDLYYHPDQKEHVDRFDFACLADWVYYLGKNEKINKYYWLRNETSQPFPEPEVRNLMFPVDFDNLVNNPEKLMEKDFDYIFVCRSAEYFPRKFNHLFDSLRAIAEGVKGKEMRIWKHPYCVDGKSRPLQYK